MIASFLDGLQNFHFLQNALITSLVIGVVSGTIGCFIILRGMSLMGDAISHAVLPGVAVSFILEINFFYRGDSFRAACIHHDHLY
ncbi:manganese transport system membrane protein MntB [Listeria aquatica FSL S10-1188]|uniref:Manganese transport system membrane protein MntB n=1 Tax=Listeria aquatica FSL S10-1188 TaxID=1265818 RepID=W7BBI5_9LIST|nr:manganese transport system membrane protein MntB [Listeria aquatica FSL S10-1188]